jgi:hypothetical protein
MRRAIATSVEFAEALTVLDEHRRFPEMKERSDAGAQRMWNKSVRFFRRWRRELENIRNDFGGHFGYKPAWFAMNHLHDGPGVFEYSENRAKGTGNVRFKFASEMVTIGRRRHARAADPKTHFRLMFRLALAAFAHAARCSQTLAVYDLSPRFRATTGRDA